MKINNTQKVFIGIATSALLVAAYSIVNFNNAKESASKIDSARKIEIFREERQKENLNNEKIRKTDAELATHVSNRVFEKVSRESYPKTADRLGLAFNRTQKIRESAAFHALRHSTCDYVEWSELDESSSPDNLAADLHCRNGLNFNISETEIEQGTLKNQGHLRVRPK